MKIREEKLNERGVQFRRKSREKHLRLLPLGVTFTNSFGAKLSADFAQLIFNAFYAKQFLANQC